MPSEQSEVPIDHYIWEGFYIREVKSPPRGWVHAADKETAMELVADEAGVENDGWEEAHTDKQLAFQIRDVEHSAVTVHRVPVYGDADD